LLLMLLFLLLFAQAEAKDVCSLSFNYGLNSLFIDKDSLLQVAQDEVELCQLCGQITRLGFLYANLPQTRYVWADTLTNNACVYTQKLRMSDCQKLTESIIDAQEEFFLGQTARFTLEDLELSRAGLSHLLEQKSQTLCTTMRCCTRQSASKQQQDQDVLEPMPPPAAKIAGGGEIRNDLRNVNNQRLTLQHEKEVLDVMKGAFEIAKLKLADEQHEVDMKEDDLVGREETLAKDRVTLTKDIATKQSKLLQQEKELQQWETDLEKIETELEKDEQRQQLQNAATTTTITSTSSSTTPSTTTTTTTESAAAPPTALLERTHSNTNRHNKRKK